MPLYVADYLADTAHLGAAESGAYLHLIMHYWKTGALPDDDAHLARIARMLPAEWAAARPTLQPFFHGGWRHKRIDAELAESARLAEAGRRGGLASARARRDIGQAKRHAEAEATRSRNPGPVPSRTATERQAPPPPNPEADASAAGAASASAASASASAAKPPPVYTDSRHELWGEGVAILTQLGTPERSARANIGRWLKHQRDDAQAVLGAIQRARDHRIIDPIPWITRALDGGLHVAEDRSVHAGIDRVLARIRDFDSSRVESGAGGEPRQADVRLLPQG
jgi:uncharacterized protein YdaU (DUF1376 family)